MTYPSLATMPLPSASKPVQRPKQLARLVTLTEDDLALWRRVRQLLQDQTGRATLVGACLYGLRLAERHLSQSADPPVQLTPVEPRRPPRT